jgi:hypothetical protein
VGLPAGAVERLHDELGFEVVAAEPIDPGVIHNNRLTRLDGADGRRVVLKVYFRDDRGRLEREFGAFAFLRRRGLDGVPEALLRDDAGYWAIYSFEPGRVKPAPEITVDEAAAIGRLAAGFHRFRPGQDGPDFPSAFAALSLADRIGHLRARLATCLRAAAEALPEYASLREVVAEVDLAASLERLIGRATAGLGGAELAAPTPDEHLRFNPGDFAPHNLLVRADGTVCAIDFEFFGPEEAAWLPAGFLAADQSLDLGQAQADAFLAAYHANRDVPDTALARYGRARALFELIWLMVNVSLMTPAHVARKRFAGDFDLAAHLAERRALVQRRLARAERVIAELIG